MLSTAVNLFLLEEKSLWLCLLSNMTPQSHASFPWQWVGDVEVALAFVAMRDIRGMAAKDRWSVWTDLIVDTLSEWAQSPITMTENWPHKIIFWWFFLQIKLIWLTVVFAGLVARPRQIGDGNSISAAVALNGQCLHDASAIFLLPRRA